MRRGPLNADDTDSRPPPRAEGPRNRAEAQDRLSPRAARRPLHANQARNLRPLCDILGRLAQPSHWTRFSRPATWSVSSLVLCSRGPSSHDLSSDSGLPTATCAQPVRPRPPKGAECASHTGRGLVTHYIQNIYAPLRCAHSDRLPRSLQPNVTRSRSACSGPQPKRPVAARTAVALPCRPTPSESRPIPAWPVRLMRRPKSCFSPIPCGLGNLDCAIRSLTPLPAPRSYTAFGALPSRLIHG
jgi:hypothetical protein